MLPSLYHQMTAVSLLLWISLGSWEQVDFLSLPLCEISFSSTQRQGMGSQFCLGSGWLRIVCRFFNGRPLHSCQWAASPQVLHICGPFSFPAVSHNLFCCNHLRSLQTGWRVEKSKIMLFIGDLWEFELLHSELHMAPKNAFKSHL